MRLTASDHVSALIRLDHKTSRQNLLKLTDCNYREVVRKIYGPIKEEESWRIRMYKEINDTLQWSDTVKFIQSLKDGLDILEG
jgi:hypothetical protein